MIPSSLNATSALHIVVQLLQQALPTLPSYVVGLFSFGIPFHSVAANSVTLLRLQLTKKKNGTLEPHYSKVPQYRKKNVR